MPTIAALLTMFVVVGIGVVMAGATLSAFLVGVVLAVGAVALGIKGWTDPGVPKSPRGWFAGAVACLALGTTVYTVECIFGKLAHPELVFLEAGLRTGPFGGVCTVVVTGWLVLFAIGGATYRGAQKMTHQMAKKLR